MTQLFSNDAAHIFTVFGLGLHCLLRPVYSNTNAINVYEITFLLVAFEGDDKTLKNPSKRPCVLPVRALASFFTPFLILSSLK